MATKKTTKTSYASASTKSGPAKGRRRPAKKGGKKGGGVVPEEPIIVGGGSVPIIFGKNFKVKSHPNKNKWEYDDPTAVVNGVAFLRIVAGAQPIIIVPAFPLPPGANAVAICYTGSSCPGRPLTSAKQSGRKAKS